MTLWRARIRPRMLMGMSISPPNNLKKGISKTRMFLLGRRHRRDRKAASLLLRPRRNLMVTPE